MTGIIRSNLMSSLFGFGIIIAILSGCSKENEHKRPLVTTAAITDDSPGTITTGGDILDDGGSDIVARGVCWGKSPNPTLKDSFSKDGTGTGSYVSKVSGLAGKTTYYLSAYATNSTGTGYGNIISFVTGELPSVSTNYVTNVAATTATCGGSIYSSGTGSILKCGVCWSKNPIPTTNDSKTSESVFSSTFTSNLTGLSPATTYYVCAYATTNVGTAYGSIRSFSTTSLPLPTVTTTAHTAITLTSTQSGGYVTSDGGYSITARGVCWSTSQNPTISDSKTTNGTGLGSFSSYIWGLSSNTTYYIRAYATSMAGTAYGSQYILKTFTGTVTDIDGNVYNTVTIGTQVWMAENLKTTKYRNGDPIAHVSDSLLWSLQTGGAYCSYYNYANYANVYGYLYNWHAVNDSRNLAPAGWHVASQTEWQTLITNTGGSTYSGGRLKENGSSHWKNATASCTNESSFTALPGGCRNIYGAHSGLGASGDWWCSTSYNTPNAYYYLLSNSNNYTSYYNTSKTTGFSVRCVKD